MSDEGQRGVGVPYFDDLEDDTMVPYWSVKECPLPGCSKTSWDKAEVSSWESEEHCRAVLLRHIQNSDYHKHSTSEEDAIVLAETCDVERDEYTAGEIKSWGKKQKNSSEGEPEEAEGCIQLW
jgi:hypothetical protein